MQWLQRNENHIGLFSYNDHSLVLCSLLLSLLNVFRNLRYYCRLSHLDFKQEGVDHYSIF